MKSKGNKAWGFPLLACATSLLFLCAVFTGSVAIPAEKIFAALTGGSGVDPALEYIVRGSRLPQAVTALLAGASLGVCGLLLQTYFMNPLAGPSILGISSGASLGVALVVMAVGTGIGGMSASLGMNTLVTFGALAGSLAIMALLMALSAIVRNDLLLLIVGILTGYLVSSAVTLLSSLATARELQGYVAWGMGTFSETSRGELPYFSTVCLLGLGASMLLAKPLDLLLLGTSYATNLGVDEKKLRIKLLLITGLLTAVVTAWCGPVSFIGMAIPHVARFQFKTDSHAVLLPATMLWGGITALGCVVLSGLPSDTVLPINALTPVIGVPVIIAVILRRA